ncbi:UNVERIFIED_CONTAM: hypothetical protein Slati_0849700 [Sesamum latifolium]|uniref:Gag/pol protein n=1 Tax=Sesamum latifolium TaxID=2727402 RepID=A0AAW2XNF5_9LAMI
MFLIYGGVNSYWKAIAKLAFHQTMMMPNPIRVLYSSLNGGVVAWKRFQADITADSTMDAEYIAASEAAKEAIWMKNYIQELGCGTCIAEPQLSSVIITGYSTEKKPRSHHRSSTFLDATIYSGR